jgi:hypothetical protein
MSAPVPLSLEADVSQLARDMEWLASRLLERFPQGVGDRISNLDGFLSRISEQVIQLEDSPTSDTGRLVIRFGLRGRAELLTAAIAALEGDVPQMDRFHGVLQ